MAFKVKFNVHRVRFVEYVPQAIHCMAFEDTDKPCRLALSRADSTIEIWNFKDNWYQETVIPGCKDTSVETLDWCKGRLFTGGLHAEITEWDLTSLLPKITVDSFGGAVWCLSVNHAKTHMAVGCEDGRVRLFEITADGLNYSKSLDQQDGRVLCLSWHLSDNTLVTGASDSTVRLYNVTSGHCTLRITVDEFQSRSTLIWAIHMTRNFVIITGDSLGNTQFWDGQRGTLIQSFKAHLADVLTVCVNKEENMVFSGGIDSKIVQFQQITNKDGVLNWVKAASQRMFSQDVRCLVTLGGIHDLLVSGGLDPSFFLYSTKEFGRSSYGKVAPFPHRPVVYLASEANILMYQTASTLQFWRLQELDTVGQATIALQKTPAQLLEIRKKGDHHIVCSAVSTCASWAAFSDVYHISLFKLNLSKEGKSQVTVTKVLPLPVHLLPARGLVFSPESSKLISATSQGSVQILDLSEEPCLSNTLSIAQHGRGLAAVNLVAVSNDLLWLACADYNNTLTVFNLTKMKLKCTLPHLESRVTSLAFQPQTNYLSVVCCNNQVYIFKPSSGKLTKWSRQALEHGLPRQWTSRRSQVINIQFNPSCHEVVLLQDHNMFTLLDLREPLPDTGVCLYETKLVQQKRKQSTFRDDDEQDTKQAAFKVCRKYSPLLFAGFTKDSSLVVVERPRQAMVEMLPPPLYRKKYGT
ncbi:U3 small nucleolar RNA-associated protein 4 homolog [Pocillopora verrucosa]|uniref:U3 small nucleolar RNA-associated protein 4 homolog n=1 Tax=Pocillopora verrucosa TaxID=203993 RepID=UPI0033400CDA